MIAEVQKYVPGYRLKNGPTFEGRKVSIFLEVEGLGDFLPQYSGNLDIMTAAAARTGEMFAQELMESVQLRRPRRSLAGRSSFFPFAFPTAFFCFFPRALHTLFLVKFFFF